MRFAKQNAEGRTQQWKPKNPAAVIASLLVTAVSLLVAYFVIRKAVFHAILDADDARRAREQELRFRDAVRRDESHPDAPTA